MVVSINHQNGLFEGHGFLTQLHDKILETIAFIIRVNQTCMEKNDDAITFAGFSLTEYFFQPKRIGLIPFIIFHIISGTVCLKIVVGSNDVQGSKGNALVFPKSIFHELPIFGKSALRIKSMPEPLRLPVSV